MQRTVELLHGAVDIETITKGQFVLTITEYILDREKVSTIRFDKAETFLKLSESMEVDCNRKVQILVDSEQDWKYVERILVKVNLHTEQQYKVYFLDFTWGDEQGKRFKFIEPEYEEIRAIALEMSKIKRVSL